MVYTTSEDKEDSPVSPKRKKKGFESIPESVLYRAGFADVAGFESNFFFFFLTTTAK